MGACARDTHATTTVAIVCGAKLAQLAHAVGSYPTRSEIWLDLLDAARKS